MHTDKKRRIALVLVLLLGWSMANRMRAQTNGQVQAYRDIDLRTYDQTLDLVFPPMKPISKGVVFRISIRARPAFDPESQLVATYFTNRPPLVDYAVAEKQVWETATHSGGKIDPDAIAKSVVVRHHVPKISRARVLVWQQGLFESLAASLPSFRRATEELERSGTIMIGLDNTRYEIVYAQANNEFRGAFDLSKQGPAIVEWARAVSDEVLSSPSGH